MKNSMRLNFRKIIISSLLVMFAFSLQSFIGVRIEKRHYRKGYYIHVWHNPKTKPVHHTAEKAVVQQEKKEVKQEVQKEKIISAPPPVAQQKQETPPSSDDDRGRNIAPVCRRPNPSID